MKPRSGSPLPCTLSNSASRPGTRRSRASCHSRCRPGCSTTTPHVLHMGGWGCVMPGSLQGRRSTSLSLGGQVTFPSGPRGSSSAPADGSRTIFREPDFRPEPQPAPAPWRPADPAGSRGSPHRPGVGRRRGTAVRHETTTVARTATVPSPVGLGRRLPGGGRVPGPAARRQGSHKVGRRARRESSRGGGRSARAVGAHLRQDAQNAFGVGEQAPAGGGLLPMGVQPSGPAFPLGQGRQAVRAGAGEPRRPSGRRPGAGVRGQWPAGQYSSRRRRL